MLKLPITCLTDRTSDSLNFWPCYSLSVCCISLTKCWLYASVMLSVCIKYPSTRSLRERVAAHMQGIMFTLEGLKIVSPIKKLQGWLQKFLAGRGEFISLYYGLTQHFIKYTEGPSITDLPWVPTASHEHHEIDQNPIEFFFPPGRKGREHSRKAKVLRIPHRILNKIFKQIPWLLPGSLYVILPYLLLGLES